uniref:Uncharacterized protein n=1 Tax=Saccharolobus islandicus TaxID=43080 RepID=Q0ZNV7_SACIS|nr:hypothetical protein [Sulfolobus islandicus]ABE99609.1 hypothetical protein [Sulfolobus islandicus]
MKGVMSLGKKLRKNGMHETTWYTFGAAAAVPLIGNTVLSNVNINGFNAAIVTDIVGGGLAGAGFYELMNWALPRLLLWLEKRSRK